MGSVHDQLHQVEAGPSGEQMTRERALELADAALKPHDLDRNIIGAVRLSVAGAIFTATAEENRSWVELLERARALAIISP